MPDSLSLDLFYFLAERIGFTFSKVIRETEDYLDSIKEWEIIPGHVWVLLCWSVSVCPYS